MGAILTFTGVFEGAEATALLIYEDVMEKELTIWLHLYPILFGVWLGALSVVVIPLLIGAKPTDFRFHCQMFLLLDIATSLVAYNVRRQVSNWCCFMCQFADQLYARRNKGFYL